MIWNDRIFAYCERGNDPSFWAEPVNALTNLAFVAAAMIALRHWRDLPARAQRRTELALVALVAVIGSGSFLFHTLATRWAALADVAPITLFMLAYLVYALVRFLCLRPAATVVLTLVFCASLPAASMIANATGGSHFAGTAGYLPALAALTAVAVRLASRRHPAAVYLLLASVLFASSLTLRALDGPLCAMTPSLGPTPLGTHFAWHLLNAAVLYVLLLAALRHGHGSSTDHRKRELHLGP